MQVAVGYDAALTEDLILLFPTLRCLRCHGTLKRFMTHLGRWPSTERGLDLGNEATRTIPLIP